MERTVDGAPEPEIMVERIERAVFEELVREHHGAVYRAAVRVLADEDAARDATQEVFLGLLRDGLPEGARDVGAVLRHRAVQRAIARLGSERRRRQREERVAMERSEAFEEGTVEREEARELVTRLLAKLPDELRAALALRFGEELTFAAIADLVGCSEPTAHDRVRRGLERLRGDLSRAGLAALAPGLPGLLQELEPPSVPVGLEQNLLALTTAATAPAVGAGAIAIAATLVLGAAGVLAFVVGPRWSASSEGAQGSVLAPDPGPRVTALEVEVEPATGAHAAREVASPAADGERFAPRAVAAPVVHPARVSGRLRDARGLPLAEAPVSLVSVERAGKLPRLELHTESARDGSFEFALAEPVGPHYLQVKATGHLEHHSARFELSRGEHLDLGELRLLPDSADAPGDFALSVHLVDDAGVPAADALVVLERRVRDERFAAAGEDGSAPAERWTWTREASGRTDAAGAIELAGGHLGAKRARVLPQRAEPFGALAPGARELAPATFAIDIDAPGRHGRVLTLEGALAIEGLIRTVDGAALEGDLANALMAIGPGDGTWFHSRVQPDGRFRIGGLTAEPHTLRVRLRGLSPFTLTELTPGGETLELLLKRAEDPRALGNHDAELHGTVVDARSGEAVEVGPFDVLAEQLWGEELVLSPAELVAHRRAHPRQYQRALGFDADPTRRTTFASVGLEPGTYALWVEAPGYSRTLVGIHELARGELRAGLEARLEAR